MNPGPIEMPEALNKYNKTSKMLYLKQIRRPNKNKLKKSHLLRVGFEPTPFRTRTLIWRLRPTRPSQHFLFIIDHFIIIYNIIPAYSISNNSQLVQNCVLVLSAVLFFN